MSGIEDINRLIKEMKPILDTNEYVFCTKECFSMSEEIIRLKPIGTFLEKEGMTIVLLKEKAINEGLSYDGVFQKITLEVHSSLEAVGLTAVISSALAKENISANVIAGFYHDHIFVPKEKSELALKILCALSL